MSQETGDGFGAVELLMQFGQEAVIPQSSLRVGDKVRLWVVTDATVTGESANQVFVTAHDEHRCVSLVERPSKAGE